MIYLDNIFFCIMILMFPILLYFIYLCFNVYNTSKQNSIMLTLSLFISTYMVLTRGELLFPRIAILSVNIPIIISYIRKKPIDAIILSFLFINICYYRFNGSIIILYAQYISIYLLYLIKNKYSVDDYMFIIQFYIIKLIIYFSRMNVIGCFFNDTLYKDKLSITLPFVIIASFLVLHMIKLGDRIINHHISYKELLKEKELKASLFKITHEIKNPLTVCNGYLSLIKSDNNKNSEYLKIIQNEINESILLVEGLASYNEIKIIKENINLSLCINNYLNDFKNILKKEKILIKNELENNIFYNGDEKKIHQVFVNIIINSIDALKNKGDNKQIRVILNKDKSFINLTVIDNGIGLSSNKLKSIGEPFFTTKEKKSGLGLAISKEIIESHDGKISFKSNINEGMIVMIKLKIANVN